MCAFYRKISDNDVPRKTAEDFAIRGGETTIIEPYFLLNDTGRLCWNSIDGKRTVEEICDSISKAFNAVLSNETIHKDIIRFLRKLKELGLIEL